MQRGGGTGRAPVSMDDGRLMPQGTSAFVIRVRTAQGRSALNGMQMRGMSLQCGSTKCSSQ